MVVTSRWNAIDRGRARTHGIVSSPMAAIMSRMTTPAADEVTDEERRHQELLAALRESGR